MNLREKYGEWGLILVRPRASEGVLREDAPLAA